MTGRAHIAAGAFAGALAGKLTGNPAAGMAVGALAGLLPDIDHPGSLLGRKVRPLAVLFENLAGHRSVTHTVWFSLLVGTVFVFAAAVFSAVLSASVPLAVFGLAGVFGSLSHIVLDGCTKSGVRPFEPLSLGGSFSHFEHLNGPLVTGDPFVEWPACVMFAAAALKLAGLL